MKRKMKQLFSLALATSLLTANALMPVSAQSTGGFGGDTQIEVGVYAQNIPDQIKVTVPVNLAMAVYANQTQADADPTVYVGTASGTTSQPGHGYLEFKNESVRTDSSGTKKGVNVEINQVIVSAIGANGSDSWSIAPESASQGVDFDKKEMKLTINNKPMPEVLPGAKKTVFMDGSKIVLNGPQSVGADGVALPEVTNVRVDAQAGGKNKDYTDETSAPAFTVEWRISTPN